MVIIKSTDLRFFKIIKGTLPRLTEEQAYNLSRDLLYLPFKMKHHLWDGRVMGWESIDKKYGRGGTKFLEDTGMLKCSRWHSKRHLMRAWTTTDQGKDLLQQLYDEKSLGEIIQFTEGKRRKARVPIRAVRRLSKSGGRTPNLDYLALRPKIDLESLEHHREILRTELELVSPEHGKSHTKLESDISQASGLISNDRTDHGNISTYRATNTGRHAGQGMSLQRCSKEVCAIALPGYFECDAENCHFRLIQQMAMRLGMNTPFIQEYLDNKAGWRNNIATHCNIDCVTGELYDELIRAVKSCLLALAYGAVLSPFQETSIASEFGCFEVAKRFCNHTDVRKLHAEVKKASLLIVRDARLSANGNGSIRNEAGFSQKSKSMTNSSLLAFLLQGAESHLMQAAMPIVEQEIAVWKYDGFLVENCVSDAICSRITEVVQSETGYLMEFSSSELSA